jgi:hypothetical protein
MTIHRCLVPLLLAVAFIGGCGEAASPEAAPAPAPASSPEPSPSPTAVAPAPAVAEVAPAASTLPKMAVHKSPSCGCCGSWVEHVEQAGHPVEIISEEDLGPLKAALGVPAAMASCHTAIVEGYFIEGHVPAQDIARLLMERPDARGLAVPGMPVGSPGMEVPSGEVQPYTVFLVNKDGSTTPFSEYGR